MARPYPARTAEQIETALTLDASPDQTVISNLVHVGSEKMKKIVKSLLPKSLTGYLGAVAYRPLRSYGTKGEDMITDPYFRSQDTGFYVDVGCFHPIVGSNTYKLYRRGWHGINIDADQYKVNLFKSLRRRDINICAVVSDNDGEAEFFYHSGESYGSMSSLDRAEIEDSARNFNRQVLSRPVRTRPLAQIIAEHNVTVIDYLTIDVEGAETAVLATIDFNKVFINVIAVEVHGTLKDVSESTAIRLLQDKGFDIFAWTPPTVFLRPETNPARFC